MDWMAILDKIDSIVLGLTTLAGGVMWIKNSLEKNQLAKTIDKSVIKNEDFESLAKKEGLKLGAKIIHKLISKK